MQTSLHVSGKATEYPRDAVIDWHDHETGQIIHASSGVMRVSSEEGNWIIPPGRALWIPAKTTHTIRCITDMSFRTVYVADPDANLPERCEVWTISPLMREVVIRLADGPRQTDIPHLSALLISEIRRKNVLPLHVNYPSDMRALKVAEALAEDPANPLTLEDWSNEVGASSRTLKRLFQAQTGVTFRQWRKQVRLLAALEKLALGEPVTNVAMAVGYDSTSAFIEMFREQLGTTPGKYFAA